MPLTSVRFISAIMVLLLALFAAIVEGQGPGLFGPVWTAAARADTVTPRAATPALGSDAITLRRRVATIDFGMLTRARLSAGVGAGSSAALTLNLFDDVVLTGIVERTEETFSGGYAIAGRILDQPLRTMTLVVNGETVAGTVRTLNGTYRIRSASERTYAISEVDLWKLPPEGEPLLTPPSDPGVDDKAGSR